MKTKTRLKKGDYVLATKWSDGAPRDAWAVGFYHGTDRGSRPPATRIDPRYYVVDNDGLSFRHNGFRNVRKISAARGAFIVAHKDHIESSRKSLWWWSRCTMRNFATPHPAAGKQGGEP